MPGVIEFLDSILALKKRFDQINISKFPSVTPSGVFAHHGKVKYFPYPKGGEYLRFIVKLFISTPHLHLKISEMFH